MELQTETEAPEPDDYPDRLAEALEVAKSLARPDKAVIYIFRPLLTTKADLDWAEFYARQRAHTLSLRVVSVLTVDNSHQDRMGMLYRLLRQVDSAVVITPSLAHVGGNPRRVTAFADLQTVDPAECHPWRTRVPRCELDEALAPEPQDHSDARDSEGGVRSGSTQEIMTQRR
ncbi:hypothetical protein ACFXG4_27045 [Nocardia sp. NPDC059246]|uniref:hypothetical protein n=1 Tax=unclassified Nocardia TaxID=2637762 RepID=UPI0036C8F4EC